MPGQVCIGVLSFSSLCSQELVMEHIEINIVIIYLK